MIGYYKFTIVFLLFVLCCCIARGRKHRHHKTLRSKIPIAPVSLYLEHYMPWREVSKKSLIEHGVNVNVNNNTNNNNSGERKSKRGFLANLANLLTDTETISGHKHATNPEIGLSSYTLAPQQTLLERNGETNNRDNINIESTLLPQSVNVVAKNENIDLANSAKEITDAVTDSGKEYAPIFAMYHGKIVTLGKLPDTAFKRTHVNSEPQPVVETPHESPVRDAVGFKHYIENSNTKVPEKSIKRDRLDTNERLQEYLKTLDVEPKESRAVAKDEVPFSLASQVLGASKSSLLSHIKGVVLDDGKVMSIPDNHLATEDIASKSNSDLSGVQQKYFVTNDGNVEPLVRSKSETVEGVQRDNLLDNNSGQKTVTLTVDVLKNLLKRSDSKVSLANLLNKPAETKSDTPQEDEDPGTIEDFAAGGLKSHNAYRSKHHDDSLIWSDELAAKAQKLAEALADKKVLEIGKDLEKDNMGENVAKVWATFKNAGDAATKMWYSQSSNYRFDDPHLDENTGQFAQIVWKATKELGMGVAKSIDDVNNKYVYVTSLYRPAGNIEAILRENVLPTGNNTQDVYSTFFKRTGVSKDNHNARRSKIQHPKNNG